MIGTFSVKREGKTVFSCEFPLEDEGVVGMKWAEGVKFCIEEFRKAHPGLSLHDTFMTVGSRP